MDEANQTTYWLNRLQEGDTEAESRLYNLVYDELRRIASAYMRRERADHILQTTALVHEAYLKLVDQREVNWHNRAHFFGVAAKVMRRILVDHARTHLAAKRGGGAEPLPLDEALVVREDRPAQIIALDDALGLLQNQDARVCKVVELRFFGGLTVEETAEVLKISTRTVKREWNFGRAWLQQQLRPS